MKRLLFILLTLVSIVIGSFSVQGAERKEAFAIYLSQRQTTDQIPLPKLKLSNEPFITDTDIIEYRWRTHEIVLTEEAAKRYAKFKRSQETRESGFVVVADGIRCYYGEFWLDILSVIPPFPVIYIDVPSSSSIRIRYDYPLIRDAARGEDPRNNKRIYDTFKGMQKLEECQQLFLSVPKIGQIKITTDVAVPERTSRPFLTFETRDGKLLKRIEFALEGSYEYPSILKFKVLHQKSDPNPLIVAVASTPGGSALNFETAILGFINGKISELMDTHIDSHSLNALCFGIFGKHRGLAFVYFDFIQAEEEAHYDPHRYEVGLYEWKADKFVRISSKQTNRKYPCWKEAAVELGYHCQSDLLEVLNSYGCDYWFNLQQKHQPDAD